MSPVLCRRNLCVSLLWLVHSCPQHTHSTHTPCGFLSVWTLCSPLSLFDLSLFFPLSHLISIPPSLSVRTGKKQGPPENRNKGNPSIHPFVPLSSILPVTHPLLTLHPGRRGVSSPSPLSFYLFIRCFRGGVLLLPCFTCNRVQLSTVLVFNSQSQHPQLSW